MTKLLYVEDNDDNVFMLKMRLELLGDFEVLTAEDGEKGHDECRKQRERRCSQINARKVLFFTIATAKNRRLHSE